MGLGGSSAWQFECSTLNWDTCVRVSGRSLCYGGDSFFPLTVPLPPLWKNYQEFRVLLEGKGGGGKGCYNAPNSTHTKGLKIAVVLKLPSSHSTPSESPSPVRALLALWIQPKNTIDKLMKKPMTHKLYCSHLKFVWLNQ